MPGGDKTGPTGAGPMTGRGAGFCSGNGMPGFANPGFNRFGGGMGFRRGGGGRGRRNRWSRPGRGFGPGMYGPAQWGWGQPADVPAGSELTELKAEAAELKQTLEEINRRISQLEK